MSDPLGLLMERNLLEVFGQRDSTRRTLAIAELYTADCKFFEAEEQVNGREALNAKVAAILKDTPGFVFRAIAPAQVNHDLGRLRWQFGPAGAPPVVTGTDIAVFDRGRIRLYTPSSTDPRAPEVVSAELGDDFGKRVEPFARTASLDQIIVADP
jgi:SnoaL-like domain